MLRKEEESNLLFPHFLLGITTSNLNITGKEKAHTFITHTFISPELGGEGTWLPPPGRKHYQIAPPLQASRFRACSPLPLPLAQSATPLEEGDLLKHRRWDFSTPSQAGNCFGFLAQAAEKKEPLRTGTSDSQANPNSLLLSFHFLHCLTS